VEARCQSEKILVNGIHVKMVSQALGVVVPPSLLLRADGVIE
jgi:hypothetical protein